MKNIFNTFFKKKKSYNYKPIKSTWTFGCNEWRIESLPTMEHKSNIKLFAENELVFEGSYGELIRQLKIKEKKEQPQ